MIDDLEDVSETDVIATMNNEIRNLRCLSHQRRHRRNENGRRKIRESDAMGDRSHGASPGRDHERRRQHQFAHSAGRKVSLQNRYHHEFFAKQSARSFILLMTRPFTRLQILGGTERGSKIAPGDRKEPVFFIKTRKWTSPVWLIRKAQGRDFCFLRYLEIRTEIFDAETESMYKTLQEKLPVTSRVVARQG